MQAEKLAIVFKPNTSAFLFWLVPPGNEDAVNVRANVQSVHDLQV